MAAVRERTGPDGSKPRLPGPVSRYGRDSDSLEAFARTMQLASFRIAGAGGTDPTGAIDWFARGLASGTDPDSPHRWPTPRELAQAKVEAASIAISLILTEPWLWRTLPPTVRRNTVNWLEHVIGASYPPINWVWFQIVVEAFLRRVGARWSAPDIESCLAVHESLYVTDGWYRDGPERAYDHYCGWALHYYPLLVNHLAPDLPGVASLAPRWKERLRRYLDDAILLIGADGSPLMQGRSLIYRFGAAAPLWAGVLADATPLAPGLTRRAASGMVRHFVDAGVPDDAGLLTVGWYGPFEPMRQAYSGAGSPYWAGVGMLGLLLPADHPVWTEAERPLPVEQHDQARTIAAPGWLVSATRADGIVRVVNHGTDHAAEGDHLTDSPWYARLAYSTATAPECDRTARQRPLDNTVALVDAAGGVSARTGFTTVSVGAHTAVSRWRAHWVEADGPPVPDHGSGCAGSTVLGPWLTVGSALCGATEIRAVRVDPAGQGPAGAGSSHLRVGGWPVAADPLPEGRAITSMATSLDGLDESGRTVREGGNQMSVRTVIPWLATTQPVIHGRVYVAALTLTGDPTMRDPPRIRIRAAGGGHAITVHWPTGTADVLELPPAPAERPSVSGPTADADAGADVLASQGD